MEYRLYLLIGSLNSLLAIKIVSKNGYGKECNNLIVDSLQTETVVGFNYGHIFWLYKYLINMSYINERKTYLLTNCIFRAKINHKISGIITQIINKFTFLT